MVVKAVSLRDFRNYERAELTLGERLTVITGANGAGKTNLLEAIYFGCAGRSPRTSNEREAIRRGADVTRVEVRTADAGGEHLLEVGFEPGEPKRLRVDGAAVENLSTTTTRPLLSVFLPERLELVKGGPSLRRAHLDQLAAALHPARAGARVAYGQALAQRNALLARVRAGLSDERSLDSWDAELARHGAELMAVRSLSANAVAPLFAERARDLGLPEPAELRYRPRSDAEDATGLATELAERRRADLERGFTAHGPHRDELVLRHGGGALRAFGSQGQQRVAVLALLFAERDLLATERTRPPLMLLDDVMSELDSERRELLGELLVGGGQAVVTATELEHVPGADAPGAAAVTVVDGVLEQLVFGGAA